MKFKKLLFAFALIIFYLLFPMVLQSIFNKPLMKLLDHQKYFIISIILLLIEVFVSVIIIYIYRHDLQKEWQKFKKNGWQNFNKYFKYYLIGYGVSIVINTILSFIFHTDSSVNEAINRATMVIYPLYAIPTIAIIGPICEEILFRKSFKDVFDNSLVFIIFTGTLFGFTHVANGLTLENIFYGLSYSSLGIAFSYIYSKTNNIFTSISLHIFHNSLTLLVLYAALL